MFLEVLLKLSLNFEREYLEFEFFGRDIFGRCLKIMPEVLSRHLGPLYVSPITRRSSRKSIKLPFSEELFKLGNSHTFFNYTLTCI